MRHTAARRAAIGRRDWVVRITPSNEAIDIRERVRVHAGAAIDTLLAVMHDSKVPYGCYVTAEEMLLHNRRYEPIWRRPRHATRGQMCGNKPIATVIAEPFWVEGIIEHHRFYRERTPRTLPEFTRLVRILAAFVEPKPFRLKSYCLGCQQRAGRPVGDDPRAVEPLIEPACRL